MATDSIVAGGNPLVYSSNAPYTILLFQMVVIVTISQLLYYPLSKVKQPRVIAEVLTGIILGHTVLGRIPNFTKYVFPSESIPGLSIVATVGICLLLFMVGCEVDVGFIKKHLFTALTVGIFNMAVPFGLGCLLAIGLWKDYRLDAPGLPAIEFTTFMVFIAVAMCITAFPVLVRILTELRLVKDRVGVVVIAAGITNDLLGWILLALSITLANSTKSEITAYIVLVTIGWCLFIIYPVRYILRYTLINWMNDTENISGPSRMAMLTILLMVFASSFFTDIIGVHPIFGAFIVGVIVPRENNYVIKLTSRIEDLVNIIFIPIYFGMSGLDVDLGLLDKGIDWAWAFGLIGVAMFGKVFGGFVAAKLNGLYWRESLTVGILMSCKGIVEIVVLQTGLRAHIITQKTYSMFILMALVTTFFTTPLTSLCYPEKYREGIQERLRQKKEKKMDPKVRESMTTYSQLQIDKVIVCLDTMDSVSNNLILLDLLMESSNVGVHAINVKMLTERTADLLHASMIHGNDVDFHSINSILSIVKMFSHANKLSFTSEIQYCLPENRIQSLLDSTSISPKSLFLLTMNTKEYSMDQFKALSEELRTIDTPRGVFINNTSSEQIDGGLHIRTIVVLITNRELDRSDLYAVKLLSMFINHADVQSGTIVLQDVAHEDPIYSVLVKQVATLNEQVGHECVHLEVKSNAHSSLESDNATLKDYISSWDDSGSHIGQLTLVNHKDTIITHELVNRKEKVMVVF